MSSLRLEAIIVNRRGPFQFLKTFLISFMIPDTTAWALCPGIFFSKVLGCLLYAQYSYLLLNLTDGHP